MIEVAAEFNNKEVIALLKQITARHKKIEEKDKEVIGLISSVVFKDVMKHFDEQRGSAGSWPKWSTRYRNFMAKIGKGGNKILQDTGRLRNLFTIKNYRVEGDSIVWFNPARTKKGFPYAFAHDEGGPVLPRRQFMWLSDSAIVEIESQIVKFLEK